MFIRMLRAAAVAALVCALTTAHAAETTKAAKSAVDKTFDVADASGDSPRPLIDAIETTMANGDASELNLAFSPEAMMDKALRGVTIDDKLRKGFVNGALTEMRRLPGIGTQLQSALIDVNREPIARFHLTRVDAAPGGKEVRATYRLLMQDDTINYVELEFVRIDGHWRIDDLFDHASSDRRSDFIRRTLLAAQADLERPALMRMINGRDWQAESQAMRAYSKAVRENTNPREIMRLYEELPKTMQSEAIILATYCTAAGRVDDATYRQALDHMLTTLGDPDALPLMRIDAHVLAGDYDKAREVTRQMETVVNDRGWMSYLRGSTYIEQGDTARAITEIEHAVEADPTLASAYWVLVHFALQGKDYDKTVRLLDAIEAHTGLTVGDLEGKDDYAGFVKSKQYAAWIADR